MKIRNLSPLLAGAVAVTASLGSLSAAADNARKAEQIVRDNCLACHTEERAGAAQWSRMSHQRKTPEGWLMTIARMQVMHGLKISDEDRRTLVKYFADRQGLAPEETAGYRYAMERRLNTQENFESAEFTEMCARCHSGARVALQRRPASEWEHLVHFHLGQWPTIEYQAMGRDRDWLGIALNSTVPQLAKQFPLDAKAWSDWQKAAKPSLAGTWRFVGNMPGKGDVEGTLVITNATEDKDNYQLKVSGHYADGKPFQGQGRGIVYTGYEWRANLEIDGTRMRQVLAATEDGQQLQGRMFETEHDEIGMDLTAFKDTGTANQVLAVQPGHIKAGTTQKLTIVGLNLGDDLSLGKGIQVAKVLSSDKDRIQVEARAEANAAPGSRSVQVGGRNGGELQVYKRIDRLQVTPAFSVARVGGNGGSTAAVASSFQAEAWSAGQDGKPGTDDDLRIGFVPAKWRVEPFDEAAKADRDTDFAGTMNPATGIFNPALAGPNPKRRMSTNNVGNLKVVAEVSDGEQMLSGDGQLIVTVQRWNNPPLP